MRAEVRRSIPLLLLFVTGTGAGVWVFVSPWALGYPTANGWSAATWTSVWIGGILVGVSAAGLIALLARTLHLAQRAGPDAE